jgi:hypothetical protein
VCNEKFNNKNGKRKFIFRIYGKIIREMKCSFIFWGDAGEVFLMQFFDQPKNFEFPAFPF